MTGGYGTCKCGHDTDDHLETGECKYMDRDGTEEDMCGCGCFDPIPIDEPEDGETECD